MPIYHNGLTSINFMDTFLELQNALFQRYFENFVKLWENILEIVCNFQESRFRILAWQSEALHDIPYIRIFLS